MSCGNVAVADSELQLCEQCVASFRKLMDNYDSAVSSSQKLSSLSSAVRGYRPLAKIGAGVLKAPISVGVGRDGGLAVLDADPETEADSLVLLDADGKVEARIRLNDGEGGGLVEVPTAAGVLPDGSVVVLDAGAQIVVRLSRAGEQLDVLDGSGGGRAPFADLADLAVDAEGRLWVADAAGAVVRLTVDGIPLRVIEGVQVGQPGGLGLDPNANLVISDTLGNVLRVFTPDGRLVRELRPDASLGGVHLESPSRLAIDPDDLIVVADRHGERLVLMDSVGAVLSSITSTFSGEALAISGGLVFVNRGRLVLPRPTAGNLALIEVS